MFKILSGLLIMFSLNFSVAATVAETKETTINIHTRFGLKFDRALVIVPYDEVKNESGKPGDSLTLDHGEMSIGTSSVYKTIEIGYYYLGKVSPLLAGEKGTLEIPSNRSLKDGNGNEIPHTLSATLYSTKDWKNNTKPGGNEYEFERTGRGTETLKYRITSDIGVNIMEIPSGEYKDVSTLTVTIGVPGE